MESKFDLQLLLELLSVDSPTGDEHRMADWLSGWIAGNVPSAEVVRLRDCIVAVIGEQPSVEIFAHVDTNGFTVGFKNQVIPIGSPVIAAHQPVRLLGQESLGHGTLTQAKSGKWKLKNLKAEPGDRLVYADGAVVGSDTIHAPYLDNRGGVWAALKVLQSSESVAVAFTTGEEMGGGGAAMCARYLWETHKISAALISDITWHTDHVRCGNGVAISRRDRFVSSQRFVEGILALAESSGIPFQVEIESAGGSDGHIIERSGYPIDWAFVGAPEKRPHDTDEELNMNDLAAMADMLKYLVAKLS